VQSQQGFENPEFFRYICTRPTYEYVGDLFNDDYLSSLVVGCGYTLMIFWCLVCGRSMARENCWVLGGVWGEAMF
jgi:hypothetical protein